MPQVLGRTSPSLWKRSKSWGSVSIYIWSGRVSYFAFLFQSLTIHSSFLIGSFFEKFTLSPKGQGADSTYANWVLLPRHVKPVHSDRDFKCMNLLIIAMAPDPALPAMRLFQSLPFVLLRSCLSSPSKPGCQPALWVSNILLLNFIFTLVSQSCLWQQQNIILKNPKKRNINVPISIYTMQSVCLCESVWNIYTYYLRAPSIFMRAINTYPLSINNVLGICPHAAHSQWGRTNS